MINVIYDAEKPVAFTFGKTIQGIEVGVDLDVAEDETLREAVRGEALRLVRGLSDVAGIPEPDFTPGNTGIGLFPTPERVFRMLSIQERLLETLEQDGKPGPFSLLPWRPDEKAINTSKLHGHEVANAVHIANGETTAQAIRSRSLALVLLEKGSRDDRSDHESTFIESILPPLRNLDVLTNFPEKIKDPYELGERRRTSINYNTK